MIYSVLGALYIGDEFSPKINTIEAALYFSLICITTVGFGDIVPVSSDARVFTLTIIMLGITVFTTSVIYIFSAIGQSTKDIVKKRFNYMKNHYVIIGSTSIAISLHKAIAHRKLPVISICEEESRMKYPGGTSVISGDLSTKGVYLKANIKKANYVFVTTDDDAVSILAAISMMAITNNDKGFKLILILNEDKNIDSARYLNPDMLFTSPSLFTEVIVKLICKEEISLDNIGDLLIHKMES